MHRHPYYAQPSIKDQPSGSEESSSGPHLPTTLTRSLESGVSYDYNLQLGVFLHFSWQKLLVSSLHPLL